MKRALIMLLLAAPLISPAYADSATRTAAIKAAEQMMEDAYVYLGISYLCQDALGTSHYHAALLAVERSATLGGKSDDDAVLMADEFAQAVRKQFPKKASSSKSTGCLDKLLSSQNALRVSQARFKKAAEADVSK